jgi:hypothetical protein
MVKMLQKKVLLYLFLILTLQCQENELQFYNAFKIDQMWTVSFEIEGRGSQFLASLDSRSVTIDQTVQIAIRKADFCVNLVRFEGDTFLKTLRQKMLWGLDNRN